MELNFSKINKNWINFLEHFSADQIIMDFTENEKGYISYKIENIFDTSVNLSDKYGFLTLSFDNEENKGMFLDLARISFKSDNFEKYKIEKTFFSFEDYPSRVYLKNNLIISFYDLDNKLEDSQKFLNRIKVFENIIIALTLLKIDKIKNKFYKF